MKKLFLFLMIILPSTLLSQTVSGLKVETAADSPSTVTFDVEWDKADLNLKTLWLDSMWVFVDYNKNGKMERLLISGGTLTAHTAVKSGTGIFIEEPNNNKGAWVYGDARSNAAGSFSAKVQLYTKETDIIIAGACAYASSYPPVGQYVSESEIVFTGTPWYELKLEHTDGNVETIESGSTFLLPCSYTVSSFTDATGAPGVFNCLPSVDIYDLTASATAYCVGDAVTFALSNTTAGRTYQLYKDGVAVDALTGTGSAETFTGTFAGAGEYTARVDAKGIYCAAQMTGTYAIAENTPPTAPTGLASNTTMFCNSEFTAATLTASGGSAGSYEWGTGNTVGDNSLGTTAGSTYAVSPSAPTTYWVRMKGAGACSAMATEGMTTAIWVYTEPAPVGTFAAFPNNYSGGTYVSLTDERDNKNYPVLKMGGRWIMARNLNYQGTTGNPSSALTWKANSNEPNTNNPCTDCIGVFWCPGTGNTSSSATCDVYGALYTWETAMVLDGVGTWVTTDDKYTSLASAGTYNHGRATANGATGSGRGICPEHWHVPTDAEWGLFFDAVEGSGSSHTNVSGNTWVGANAGKYSKAKCTGSATDSAPLWTPNESNKGTDTYGFRGLPTGRRSGDGSDFWNRGNYSIYWSSSARDGLNAWDRQFFYDHTTVYHYASNRFHGFSVRCIRDL